MNIQKIYDENLNGKIEFLLIKNTIDFTLNLNQNLDKKFAKCQFQEKSFQEQKFNPKNNCILIEIYFQRAYMNILFFYKLYFTKN